MTTAMIVLGIILLLIALFLIVAVLMQNGKSHGLSGAIAGGAETFFGKQKGGTIEKKLSKITTVVAVIFVVVVLVVYIIQDQTDFDALANEYLAQLTATDTADDSDTSAPDETTANTAASTADASTDTDAAE